MKKQLLLVAFAALGLSASAQTLQLQDVQTTQPVPNGSTISYTYTDSTTYFDNHFDVINPTSTNMNVYVRKIVLYSPPNTNTTYCTNTLCYAPTTTLSTSTAPVPANNGTMDLKVEYKPATSNPATTAVRYSIWDATNPSDSIYFIVVYNGVTSVPHLNLNQVTLSAPAPNPAVSTFSMQYQLGAKTSNAQVVIYNMLGEKIKETPLTEEDGSVKIDVSTMQQGIYFCSLTIDGKAVATRRVIVTR